MPAFVPSDVSAAMLDGSHSARYVVDLFQDGTPGTQGLRIEKVGQVQRRKSGKVQTSGRFVVQDGKQGLLGDRSLLAPVDALSPLAPYGQECVISREVSLGDTVIGSVALGRFRITGVPTIAQTARRYGSALAVTSSTVEVEFSDLFEPIEADDFEVTQAPQPGNSTWSEIRRFSPWPVVMSLPDAAVPSTLVYPDSRGDTIALLASNLVGGGEPALTREGALTARLADPLAADVQPSVNLTGTIVDMPSSMKNDYYNVVVVFVTTGSSTQILARAEILTGPLRARPGNRRVYRRNAGLATSQAASQALADSLLLSLSRNRVQTVRIACLPNVAIELGDVVLATDPQTNREVVGVASSISYNLDPTELMQVELETRVGAAK